MTKFFFVPINIINIIIRQLQKNKYLQVSLNNNCNSFPNTEMPIKITKDKIVFVHGVMGWGNDNNFLIPSYWDTININYFFPNAIIPTLSWVYNNRNRAIDLFYSIKGGLTDFGKEYSKKRGLNRYGKYYDGFYPEWCDKNPLIFNGHSMGGPTIKWLCYLLKNNKIPVYNITNGLNYIKSFITTSAVNKEGLPYIIDIGMYPSIKKAYTKPKIFSFIWIIWIIISLYYKYCPILIKTYFWNVDMEIFNLDKLSFFELFSSKYNKSLIYSNTFLIDVLCEKVSKDNKKIQKIWNDDNVNIIYLNIINNSDIEINNKRITSYASNLFILFISLLLGSGTFTGKNNKPVLYKNKKFKYKEWLVTDGIVPVLSQYIPINNKKLKRKNLFDPEVYNKKTNKFLLKPYIVYELNLYYDHIRIINIFNSNTNTYLYYKTLSNFIYNLPKN